jgi:NADH-quinone oxidoreductase subunit H
MFFLAEFMNTVTMSALIITLFLGGPNIPWEVPFLGAVSPLWFGLKLLVLLFTYVWLRATLPRFRYDQLMDLGWKKLIPASLLWLLALAAIRLGGNEDNGWWGRAYWLFVAIIGIGVTTAVLTAAMRVGRASSEAEYERERMAASRAPLRTGGK